PPRGAGVGCAVSGRVRMTPPADPASAALIATRPMLTSASPLLLTVTHWPGPIVLTGCTGKAGTVVESRGPIACCVVRPGEPISSWAVKAPLTPTWLRVVSVGSGEPKLPRPAALSNETRFVELPNLTP